MADEQGAIPEALMVGRMGGYMGAIRKGGAFILDFGTDGEELVRIADVQPADDVCCKVRLAGTTFWLAEFDFRSRAVPVDTPAADRLTDTGEEEWPAKWAGPLTVGNMIANLRTMPADMRVHSAYHLIREGQPARLFVKHPTVSRERVDGREIKMGDESVPYSAVIWSHGRDPEIATHKTADAGAMRSALQPFLRAAEPILHNDRDRWDPDEWHNRLNNLTVGQFRALHAAAIRNLPDAGEPL